MWWRRRRSRHQRSPLELAEAARRRVRATDTHPGDHAYGRRPTRFYGRDSLGTEIYDALAELLIAGSPVEGDAEFYVQQARRWGGPVLDIGCGTGRIGIALAEQEVDVVGLDLSAPMLRIAERKRASLPAEIARRLTLVLADMTDFTLDQTFPLIVTPSRSFQFMLTPTAQRAALASMRRHLRPGGALVLDLFDPRLDWCVPGPDANEPSRQATIRNSVTGLNVRSRSSSARPIRCVRSSTRSGATPSWTSPSAKSEQRPSV